MTVIPLQRRIWCHMYQKSEQLQCRECWQYGRELKEIFQEESVTLVLSPEGQILAIHYQKGWGQREHKATVPWTEICANICLTERNPVGQQDKSVTGWSWGSPGVTHVRPMSIWKVWCFLCKANDKSMEELKGREINRNPMQRTPDYELVCGKHLLNVACVF